MTARESRAAVRALAVKRYRGLRAIITSENHVHVYRLRGGKRGIWLCVGPLNPCLREVTK